MRELIVTQNITLDGVIDAAEGWFEPSGEEGTDQSEAIEAVREGMATTDALLFGRVTFEQIAGGVVDEYRLFVYPVVLGRGRRLFADATSVPRLRLAETRPFRSGIVLLRYRTARDRGEPVGTERGN